MSPIPPGFSIPIADVNSIERLVAYAATQVIAAGNNAEVFANENALNDTRAVQIFPLQIGTSANPWVLICRLSNSIPLGWAGNSSRLWAQVNPTSGANTQVPASWQFPQSLGLTTWERVFHWGCMALQAVFPDFLAPERGTSNMRAITSLPYPIDWGAERSWRLISRVSLPAAANLPAVAPIWMAVQQFGTTPIPSTFTQ